MGSTKKARSLDWNSVRDFNIHIFPVQRTITQYMHFYNYYIHVIYLRHHAYLNSVPQQYMCIYGSQQEVPWSIGLTMNASFMTG